jgi:uncharacterized OB-fold protein
VKDVSFAKFGKASYVAETKVHEFVRFLEQGKIMGSKCKNCQRLYFPPRADCDCMDGETEWIQLSGNCKLITYTTLHFAPPSFRYDVPYTLGVAQFDEGPTVFAPLSKYIKSEQIKIGMKLKLKPMKLSGDKIIYELRDRSKI